jgi:Planctomycete cytochrome C
MVDAPSRYQPGDGSAARVVVPADAAASVLLQRMRSRDARTQMPPLGSEHPDAEGLALLTRWIVNDLKPRKDPS